MKHIFELPENKFKTVKINFSRAVIDGKIKAVLETKSGKILAEFPTGLGVMRCIFADRKGNSIVCSDYSKGNSVPFLIVNGVIQINGYDKYNDNWRLAHAFRPAASDGSVWESGPTKFKVDPAIYSKEERNCLFECINNLTEWGFTGTGDAEYEAETD